ncbi:hypothetical protein KBD20_00910 [Candidatus Saccharibacteria bacterium]|nr:hypothetical protein [Candidatus Saccharibacteria bacterium]
MKSILKKFIASVAAIAVLVAPSVALVPSAVHASTADGVCKGVLVTDPDSGVNSGTTADDCNEDASGETFASLAQKIINVFSIVVGTVSVIMIIVGGFRYIISGGDSGGVTAGKNTILYAIVGLVIVIFAQVIVRFVLTNV